MARLPGARTTVIDLNQHLKETIRTLLLERGGQEGICPREAARSAAGSGKRGDWEPLMPHIRQAAQALVDAGEIVVTQQGSEVEVYRARGPVRLEGL
jgi:hypothetical protein